MYAFFLYMFIFQLFAKAQRWASLTAAQRSSVKAKYAAAGIKLMVTAFGDSNTPTTSNADPIATANTFAAWVIQYQLDGIDVDYEDFQAFNVGNGKAEVRYLMSVCRDAY
jgi:hypothetical protein